MYKRLGKYAALFTEILLVMTVKYLQDMLSSSISASNLQLSYKDEGIDEKKENNILIKEDIVFLNKFISAVYQMFRTSSQRCAHLFFKITA